jgi:hypothetical protein
LGPALVVVVLEFSGRRASDCHTRVSQLSRTKVFELFKSPSEEKDCMRELNPGYLEIGIC